jgi:hypothetical protein
MKQTYGVNKAFSDTFDELRRTVVVFDIFYDKRKTAWR